MRKKVIAFDADDTLWDNEVYFRETENIFYELVQEFTPPHTTARELLQIEIKNLPLYGYGIKGFMLSMIEAAIQITNNQLPPEAILKIIDLGKELLQKPIVLIEGVEEVLQTLKQDYKLVVATKGDLLDQERKLYKSGLTPYFHHIEIMSEKKENDYMKLLKHLDIKPQEFVMIGNSLKSDILPVLTIGAMAIHIPYHITWAHESIDAQVDHANFRKVVKLKEITALFSQPNFRT
jgi:putative hydrolase of the HAD superfamily